LLIIFCCVCILYCAACKWAALAYAQRSKAGLLVCAELAAFAWVQDVAHCALRWGHGDTHGSEGCRVGAAAVLQTQALGSTAGRSAERLTTVGTRCNISCMHAPNNNNWLWSLAKMAPSLGQPLHFAWKADSSTQGVEHADNSLGATKCGTPDKCLKIEQLWSSKQPVAAFFCIQIQASIWCSELTFILHSP
jgi:hypothetical protein